jgi:hypothetical protein
MKTMTSPQAAASSTFASIPMLRRRASKREQQRRHARSPQKNFEPKHGEVKRLEVYTAKRRFELIPKAAAHQTGDIGPREHENQRSGSLAPYGEDARHQQKASGDIIFEHRGNIHRPVSKSAANRLEYGQGGSDHERGCDFEFHDEVPSGAETPPRLKARTISGGPSQNADTVVLASTHLRCEKNVTQVFAFGSSGTLTNTVTGAFFTPTPTVPDGVFHVDLLETLLGGAVGQFRGVIFDGTTRLVTSNGGFEPSTGGTKGALLVSEGWLQRISLVQRPSLKLESGRKNARSHTARS